MLSYPTSPGDVDNLIAADHAVVDRQLERLLAGEGDRRVLADQVSYQLSLHAAAEERVVYPVLREVGLAEWADQAQREHQEVKEQLTVIDREDPGSDAFEAALGTLAAGVRAHVREEEDHLLPQLRVSVGPERLLELGHQFIGAKRSAPTHAHPHAPTTGIGHAVTDAATRLVDMVRDVATGRAARLATDGSGRLVPEAQAILDALSDLTPQPAAILAPEDARAQPGPDAAVRKVLDDRGLAGPEPVGSVTDLRIPDGAGGEQTLRVYHPAPGAPGLAGAAGDGGADRPLPVLLWIHGGGWVLFDLDTYDASCRGLANKAGCIVVSPDYRRAPEAPFPAAHDDVLAAWRWARTNASSFGGDPARMAIGGESVGGTMATATTLALATAGEPLPRALVCVHPLTTPAGFGESMVSEADARPLDLALLSWMAMHAFAGAPEAATDPRVDLLSVPESSLAALPPTLVVVAERDPLRSQGEELAARLGRAGVDVTCTRYPGVMHGFFGAAAVLAEADLAQLEAADLIARTTRPPAAGLAGPAGGQDQGRV